MSENKQQKQELKTIDEALLTEEQEVNKLPSFLPGAQNPNDAAAKSHVLFHKATTNAHLTEEANGPINAIDLTSNNAFIAYGDKDASLVVECSEPVEAPIGVLEVAFVQGKQRRTKFGVDYIDVDGNQKHIADYESPGKTTNFEKYQFPEKITGIKGIVIKFIGNSDNSPLFAVKGVRLAKDISKPL
ncbi:MAG TPA: hypothetical protein VFX18_00220 [Candidatus Nitrosocosmicus sp.]|nr:hypothetical protein [Candidatus Nitrosocosmicus sp.]